MDRPEPMTLRVIQSLPAEEHPLPGRPTGGRTGDPGDPGVDYREKDLPHPTEDLLHPCLWSVRRGERTGVWVTDPTLTGPR